MIIGRFDLGNTPLVLAPMEEISDITFRSICREMGADLSVSEFISADALVRNAAKSMAKMRASSWDNPRVVQIFGKSPEIVSEAAIIAVENGADIIDLNFGCPVKKIVSKGGGAALLQNLPLMSSIAKAVVDSVRVPVTAKTRLGWDAQNIVIEQASLMLQDAGIAALAIHARTRSQMYGGLADWSWITKVKHQNGFSIPLIGNGDLDSPEKIVEAFNNYGVDAAMIGRAAIGNPFIFRSCRNLLREGVLVQGPTFNERIEVLRRHLNESILWKGEKRAVIEIRKHVSPYFRGLSGFKPFKIKLMMTINKSEFDNYLNEIQLYYSKFNQ